MHTFKKINAKQKSHQSICKIIKTKKKTKNLFKINIINQISVNTLERHNRERRCGDDDDDERENFT